MKCACGKVYSELKRLNEHKNRVHKEVNVCEFCQQTAPTKYSLDRHVGRRHQDKTNNGSQTNVSFDVKGNWDCHHLIGNRVCGRTFEASEQQEYLYHIRRHDHGV